MRPSDGTALTSAGGGVRLFLGGDLKADLGVAVPFGYRAPDNWSRHPRFLFTLSNALRPVPSAPPRAVPRSCVGQKPCHCRRGPIDPSDTAQAAAEVSL